MFIVFIGFIGFMSLLNVQIYDRQRQMKNPESERFPDILSCNNIELNPSLSIQSPVAPESALPEE